MWGGSVVPENVCQGPVDSLLVDVPGFAAPGGFAGILSEVLPRRSHDDVGLVLGAAEDHYLQALDFC